VTLTADRPTAKAAKPSPAADSQPAAGPAERLTPDLCVIGGGAGGLAAAKAAAALGGKVVLIERGRLGGQRLHSGCLPSQALIAAARRAQAVRTSGVFGIKTGRFGVEFHAVNDHITAVMAAMVPNDSPERLEALGIKVIAGTARFKDSRTVIVGDSVEVQAKRFVVATGSSPAIPDIPGLDQTPHLTTDTIFESRSLPKQLIVLGAGRTGLELAQAFKRLGATVTVLDAGRPLAHEDPDAARIVVEALLREGIDLRTETPISRVRRVRNRIEITLDADGTEDTVEGTDLLIAAGQRANIEGLDLAAARIRSQANGIVVDRHQRTSNRRIYAIGDVAGSPQSSQAAASQAGRVIRRLMPGLAGGELQPVPRITFTDPELAHVGQTEAEARTRHRKIRILRWPYRENARAQAERTTTGHIKVVTDRSGTVLGATIVGANAGELIATWTLAVAQRMTISTLAFAMAPHPTLAEISQQVATSSLQVDLTASRSRSIVGWLRRRRR